MLDHSPLNPENLPVVRSDVTVHGDFYPTTGEAVCPRPMILALSYQTAGRDFALLVAAELNGVSINPENVAAMLGQIEFEVWEKKA